MQPCIPPDFRCREHEDSELPVSDFCGGARLRRSSRREGSLRDRELQITRPDGAVRTVLDTWYSNTDPETGEAIFHGILVDITARKQLENQLIEQSVRDPLTGCYNRRHLATLYSERRDPGAEWGCIYVDIDHFKQYNDVHGHSSGDTVLLKMSRFLMRHVRAEEPVIRMGGDEFLIALFETGKDETQMIAHRLQKAGTERSPVSFSLGWAAREGDEKLEDTVNRADHELIQVRVVQRPGNYTRGPRRRSRSLGQCASWSLTHVLSVNSNREDHAYPLQILSIIAFPALPRPGNIITRPVFPALHPRRPCVPCPQGQGVVKQSSHVRADLVDRVLRYEVTETFVNRGAGLGEADYIFPLPKGAAFEDLKLSINGELVSGETMSAERARSIYEQIVRQQRDRAGRMDGTRHAARADFRLHQVREESVVRFQMVAEREGEHCEWITSRVNRMRDGCFRDA